MSSMIVQGKDAVEKNTNLIMYTKTAKESYKL